MPWLSSSRRPAQKAAGQRGPSGWRRSWCRPRRPQAPARRPVRRPAGPNKEAVPLQRAAKLSPMTVGRPALLMPTWPQWMCWHTWRPGLGAPRTASQVTRASAPSERSRLRRVARAAAAPARRRAPAAPRRWSRSRGEARTWSPSRPPKQRVWHRRHQQLQVVGTPAPSMLIGWRWRTCPMKVLPWKRLCWLELRHQRHLAEVPRMPFSTQTGEWTRTPRIARPAAPRAYHQRPCARRKCLAAPAQPPPPRPLLRPPPPREGPRRRTGAAGCPPPQPQAARAAAAGQESVAWPPPWRLSPRPCPRMRPPSAAPKARAVPTSCPSQWPACRPASATAPAPPPMPHRRGRRMPVAPVAGPPALPTH
mmetsp:Transcript_20431/g.64226  ORF Transcript_20431/g.64226 Transcript_20431/m.64226 type:complete len:364 (+) Transcript_20431:369-1460(+)